METLTTTALIIATITTITTWLGLRYPRLMTHFSFSSASPSWLTAFTAAFFHTSFKHLLTNMLCLFCVTYHLQGLLSVAQFAAIYILGIFGGSLFYLVYGTPDSNKSAIGASAATMGIVACAFCSHASFAYFNCNVPGLALVILLMAVLYLDLESTNQSGWAHLGGVFYSIIAFFALEKGSITSLVILICFCTICQIIHMVKKYNY
jgi:membrane associated rhomboid family serine protease